MIAFLLRLCLNLFTVEPTVEVRRTVREIDGGTEMIGGGPQVTRTVRTIESTVTCLEFSNTSFF